MADPCEECVHYDYDEELEAFVCQMDLDEDEFLNVERIPVGELEKMARRGEIRDAKTLCALFLIQDKI